MKTFFGDESESLVHITIHINYILIGLDNYMLEHESQFDENTVRMITQFILRLQQPVCVVAHNGNRFDFPILKKQITKLNMVRNSNYNFS